MTSPPAIEYREFLRPEMMPHILCPGCGHGVVLKAILRSIQRLGLSRDEVVFVSGIGCSSRIVGYIDFCTLHTTHGRSLTFATGLKLARPDLHVVVVTGDGDALAIGGNHLIHAARRNADITCLLLNNAIYGMTGGQGAPTTPEGARISTMPASVEPSFDACRLAAGAGATFVARGMTSAPVALDELITAAMSHRGFSFLEILSDCPEYFGRYNGLGRGMEMLEAQRRHSERVDAALSTKRFVGGVDASTPRGAVLPTVASGILHRETRPDLGEILRARAAGLPPARPVLALAGRSASPPVDGRAAGECRVRLAGAGGQGIVLAGLLLAEAAVRAGRNATHAQAYGPESRGGASRAEVIVADGEIDYPYADHVDVLLALTQEAHDRYAAQLEPGGLLVADAERVRVGPGAARCHALPILATAQRLLGSTLGANLVALGALVGLSSLVPESALIEAVTVRRPGGSAENAARAVRAGLDLARASLG